MQLKDLFYKWVPIYIKLPVLLILLFTILVANGIFLGNTTYMYSSLALYAEPYTLAYNAMYIGMGLGLLIEIRLKMRFSNKSLLLYGLLCMLLMNIVCATTTNSTVVIAACLFLGFAKMTALMEVYIIWLFVWSKTLDTTRLYPFIYFIALAGLYFTTWYVTKLTYDYNWQYAYISIIVMVLFCIVLTLIFVENDRLKKILPLYQMDWIGLLLLAAIMMLIDYIVVYGKVEDWFNSTKIQGACFGLLFSILYFIRREITIKRPILDLKVFGRSNFRVGLLYFFLMGIFVPSTFQSAFSVGILQYETTRNMEVNLYLIPGIFAGCVLCYIWYLKKLNPVVLIISGFSGFVLYHIIMYQSFSLTFSMSYFWLPSLVKGFSLALFYISVGLYATNNFDIGMVATASGIIILIRSFLGGGVFSSIYGYLLYSERIKHFNYLAGLTDRNNFLAGQQGGLSEYYKNLQQQATLTASKEITGYIIIAGCIILASILLNIFYQKLKTVILSFS